MGPANSTTIRPVSPITGPLTARTFARDDYEVARLISALITCFVTNAMTGLCILPLRLQRSGAGGCTQGRMLLASAAVALLGAGVATIGILKAIDEASRLENFQPSAKERAVLEHQKGGPQAASRAAAVTVARPNPIPARLPRLRRWPGRAQQSGRCRSCSAATWA